MVVANGFCSHCGHPKGCIGHWAKSTRLGPKGEKGCENCPDCENPLLYHQLRILEEQYQALHGEPIDPGAIPSEVKKGDYFVPPKGTG